MERQYIEHWFSNEGTRNDVRKRVLEVLMEEAPGTGAGELSSKYTYYVETREDGNRVYLSRPAFLNKGFDFVIRVENADYGHKGSYKNVPSHKDISADLETKKQKIQKCTKNSMCFSRKYLNVMTCQKKNMTQFILILVSLQNIFLK